MSRTHTVFVVSSVALVMVCSISTLSGATVLTAFAPSAMKSAYGPVMRVALETPALTVVDAHKLAFHSPGSMVRFSFPEPVWIVAYETEIHDAKGQTPNDNFLCHTFLGTQHIEQLKGADGKTVVQEMKGLFSDAFTRSVHLPDGFAIRLLAGDEIEWMPMFNNRSDDDARVAMSATIHFIRERELRQQPKAVYSVLESVSTPHLFYVRPGRHQQETTFELPFNGSIHMIGAHIHPYAKSVSLRNVTRSEPVWKGVAREDGQGRTVGMSLFSDAKGYAVHAGETFELVSVYDNPNKFPIDAMAGVFLVYTKQ